MQALKHCALIVQVCPAVTEIISRYQTNFYLGALEVGKESDTDVIGRPPSCYIPTRQSMERGTSGTAIVTKCITDSLWCMTRWEQSLADETAATRKCKQYARVTKCVQLHENRMFWRQR